MGWERATTRVIKKTMHKAGCSSKCRKIWNSASVQNCCYYKGACNYYKTHPRHTDWWFLWDYFYNWVFPSVFHLTVFKLLDTSSFSCYPRKITYLRSHIWSSTTPLWYEMLIFDRPREIPLNIKTTQGSKKKSLTHDIKVSLTLTVPTITNTAAQWVEPQLSTTSPGARNNLPPGISLSKMENPLFLSRFHITPQQVILEALLLNTSERGLFRVTPQKSGKHWDARTHPDHAEPAESRTGTSGLWALAHNGICYESKYKWSLKH